MIAPIRGAVGSRPIGRIAGRITRLVATLALGALATAGCSSSSSDTRSEPDLPEVGVDPIGEVDVAPARSDGRELRRMDLDQLKASITRVSGGLTWTEVDEEGVTFDVLDSLSGSLGKPDFLNSNTEEVTPSLLFLKFLDDAANSVCRQWVQRESASPSGRTLVTKAEFSDTPQSNPAAISANLQHLLLHFHGKPAADDDPRLPVWSNFFARVYNINNDTRAGWRTVCVAMFTHPDFYTF